MAETFEAFMKRRAAAALAYVQGDGAPVDELSTENQPASFFGPGGGVVEGAAAMRKAFADGAKSFEPVGESQLDIIASAADEHLAFWTGIQRATVKFRGAEMQTPMNLRITEMFRREAGEWKLTHRHADLLKAEVAAK